MHYMHYKDYIHHGLAAEKTPPPLPQGGEPSGWVGGGVGVPAHIYIYKYDNICKASQTTATAKQLDLDHEIGYSLQIFSLRHPQWEAANHQTDAYESEAADTQNEPSVGDNWYHLSRRQWHSVSSWCVSLAGTERSQFLIGITIYSVTQYSI